MRDPGAPPAQAPPRSPGRRAGPAGGEGGARGWRPNLARGGGHCGPRPARGGGRGSWARRGGGEAQSGLGRAGRGRLSANLDGLLRVSWGRRAPTIRAGARGGFRTALPGLSSRSRTGRHRERLRPARSRRGSAGCSGPRRRPTPAGTAAWGGLPTREARLEVGTDASAEEPGPPRPRSREPSPALRQTPVLIAFSVPEWLGRPGSQDRGCAKDGAGAGLGSPLLAPVGGGSGCPCSSTVDVFFLCK